MATNVNPGNDMWQGGAIHRLAPPTAQSGGIDGPNTSVSSPIGGVNPGTPFFARPNTGSNIRVPYNRLCPLSSEAGGGLAAGPMDVDFYEDPEKFTYRNDFDTGLRSRGRVRTETEDLHASRIAFILGKRSSFTSGPGAGNMTNNPDFPYLDSYGINQQLSTGVGSVHRMQKLCSLEYLQRYFTNRLVGRSINMNAGMNPEQWRTGLLKRVKGMIDDDDQIKTITMIRSADLCKALGKSGSDAEDLPEIFQGIFTDSNSPFLHGMPTRHHLVESRGINMDLPEDDAGDTNGGESKTMRRRVPFQTDRALGNAVAFDYLVTEMQRIGLMDWTPDGIVLSKGTNDPSDKLSDEFIEARDGALYNIVVQGPTISTSWSGKKELAVLPMDKVFVVIVADLWRLSDDELEGAYNMVKQDSRWTTEQATAYKKLVSDLEDLDNYINNFLVEAEPLNKILTNFRIRVSTSSEMTSYGQLKFYQGKPVKGSRMGLRHTEKMSEYIVGGWHLGNVMDSAASRRAMPGAGNIVMKTAPNTMAHNINVNISWWSADQMWDAFMNKEGKLRTRYDMEQYDFELSENKVQNPLYAKVVQAEEADDDDY